LPSRYVGSSSAADLLEQAAVQTKPGGSNANEPANDRHTFKGAAPVLAPNEHRGAGLVIGGTRRAQKSDNRATAAFSSFDF